MQNVFELISFGPLILWKSKHQYKVFMLTCNYVIYIFSIDFE
jgi:hypothetical protein